MTKISLTPIIDVVFILLIFFMLATNFQSFNKTEIKISNETASISQSDKKIFLIEFNKDSEFKLNGTTASLDSIKSDIISSKNNGDDFVVITKPLEGADVQLILSVLANLKSSNIENVTLGVSKDNTDTYNNKKESVKMPLLEKLWFIMRIKIKNQIIKNEDNLLPLVNIIFLLLIFFMLAGVIAKQKELHNVNLASATIEEYVEKDKNTLFINADGSLTLNDQSIDKSLLKEKLMLLKTENILIAADGSLDSSSLNKILLILSNSKIKNVTLLSNTNEWNIKIK